MTKSVLEVDSIKKQFAQVKAVDHLSFDVREGEVFALLGPNGAGKTTTVRMLMGIIRPDEGVIRYSISNSHSWSLSEELGYLPEERGLYKDTPVLRTLVYLATLRGMRNKQAREAALRQRVGRQELDGLLIIKSLESAELVTYNDQLWTKQLESFLTNARNQARLTELNLGSQELATVTAPFNVASSYHHPGTRTLARIEMAYAGALAALMILAIFACYQYQFTSITGEKHRRVTEQIISAISPQVWMDGKILGISAVGLALIIVYGTVSLLMSGVVFWLAGYNPIQLFSFVNIPLTLLQLVLALLGILFWNCFFAAIAATVDDPNTSSRSVFMFLPFLPVIITIAGIRQADSTLMKVLGIIPVTSPTALSARLVLTSVAWWEVLVAIVLLVGTIWLLRKAAARIFRLAMLMYGKEPSLRELARWLYEQ